MDLQATRKGQTGIPVPTVTNKLPTLADLRSLSAGAATSEEASYTQSDSEPDSPAPRDRMKYLTILEEARGLWPSASISSRHCWNICIVVRVMLLLQCHCGSVFAVVSLRQCLCCCNSDIVLASQLSPHHSTLTANLLH